MSNEMYNVLARVTDGLYEGIAIGGDVYPGSTLSDHVLRFNNIPQVPAHLFWSHFHTVKLHKAEKLLQTTTWILNS